MEEIVQPFGELLNGTEMYGDVFMPGLPPILTFCFLVLPSAGLLMIFFLSIAAIHLLCSIYNDIIGKWMCYLLILFLCYLRLILYHARIHLMARNLPGPKGAPILGTFYKLIWGSHIGLVWFMKEADALRREGKNIICFNIFGRIYTIPITASAAKDFCESPDLLQKGRDYEFIRPWLRNGLLTSHGPYWRRHRKMLTPAFHFGELAKHLSTFRRHADVLVDILREKCDRKIDAYPFLKRCALDIICEVTIGRSYNIQLNAEDEYPKAVESFNTLVQRYSAESHMWVPFIWNWLYEEHKQKLLVTLHDFTERAIADRREKRNQGDLNDEDRTAFLDRLLDSLERDELSMDEVREEVDTFVFAGHDTTSTTLGWLLWCLATNPHWQQQLHEELDNSFFENGRDLTVADLNQLHLLDRCIKESMRIYATAPFTERLVERDTMIGGCVIPAGSEVFLSPMLLHHNQQVYPNDWIFDPDRFLPENCAARNCYDYVPFSAGPRNCIGQKFAALEVKLVAATILRSFGVSSEEKMTSNVPAPEVILRPMSGIRVNFHQRN